MTDAAADHSTVSVPAPVHAPVAERRDSVREFHGDRFRDPYEWLRDKESPEVISHLEAETAFAESSTAHLASTREQIFQEIKGRVQETDLSVPWRRGDWWYFGRTVEGGEHGIRCRVPATAPLDSEDAWTPPVVEPGVALPGEEVLLDGNAEAAAHDFWSLGAWDVSLDGRWMLWAADTTGDERFTVRIKDLTTGEVLPDEIPGTSYGAFLSPDGRAVYYTEVDDSWRPWRVRRHDVGAGSATTPLDADALIAQEEDPGLWLGAGLSADRRWLVLDAGCSEFSEVSILPLDAAPGTAPTVVIPRGERVLYQAEPVRVDGRDVVLVSHDHGAADGRLSLLELDRLGLPLDRAGAVDVISPREDLRLQGFAVTADHLLVSVRENTLPTVLLLPLAGLGTPDQAPVTRVWNDDGDLASVNLIAAEHDSPVVRFAVETFLRPTRIFDLILSSSSTGSTPDNSSQVVPVLRQEKAVLGGYDPADYEVERDWATAIDGTRIPVTLIRRRGLLEPAPAVVYAYGSYEISMDPAFSYSRISLLDRGAVWVIAHARGGGECGRAWYDDGKKLRKNNTFTDVVAVTEHVGRRADVDADRLVLMGGSAGGLMVGAVLNLAPHLYRGAVASVPFVDPLTSILMPELPLTALEWEEWGNPIEDREVYAYMKAYSPYENISTDPGVAYPPILAVTSLHDTRVLYVEPAKWVAALRHARPDAADQVIMRIEMAGGHGGASGRYQQWRDTAWEDTWALERMGLV
ncbi:S9 family peptidase [Kocuria sp. JC486]|uniref:S9 family peptidase n=1 Tax=Kocuria sp. JC486 TaxID=1970736 RepID=UPI0014215312|nr:S9 family peptidase [Kocuria sp. JC486]NHU84935.1 S9 family peptidase [Kocuria sp. JC486]